MDERGPFPENASAREISSNGHGEGTDAVSAPLTDVDREPYLRHLLEEFEGGKLDAYEYTQRVQAVGRATSLAELGSLAQSSAASEPASGPEVARPVYDAVDLALMKASSARSSAKGVGRTKNRYAALLVIVIVFVVLLIIGILLATHVHGTPANSGAGPTAAAAATVHAGFLFFGSGV